MKTKAELTEFQAKVLSHFKERDKDYDIALLHFMTYGVAKQTTVRNMQQKLAPMFKTINRKLDKLAIIPGDTKRSYRLSNKGE